MAPPSAVSSRRNRARAGPRRSVEQMRKDAEALALHCQGKTYPQIAEELSLKGRNRAFEAVKRATIDMQREKLEQTGAFATAIERIMMGIRKCQEIIDTPHYLAGRDGKIVTMLDETAGRDVPVLDSAPALRATTEQRHLNDQLIRLMDLNPPTKSRLEVVTEDVVDREIARIAEENAMLRAAETLGAGQNPAPRRNA